MANLITREQLLDELHYDPETGVFTWRKDGGGQYKRVGARAGSKRKGYRRIMLHGRNYQAARLAWLYVHGRWPEPEVDHIDRNRDNDRIANLREATLSQNRLNRGPWTWSEEARQAFCARNGYRYEAAT